ncbi:uncharacterized protein METZ01_LOCUS463640 [marine metagenome]|uniref:Uncharacterized protein n=1 Tax=marine metagenome TaxID=408172 RepID=A0A383AS71_9ZZZZ
MISSSFKENPKNYIRILLFAWTI